MVVASRSQCQISLGMVIVRIFGLAVESFLHRIDIKMFILRTVTNFGFDPPVFNFGLVLQLVLRLWAQYVWYDMISNVWL